LGLGWVGCLYTCKILLDVDPSTDRSSELNIEMRRCGVSRLKCRKKCGPEVRPEQ